MDRLISEKSVLEAFREYQGSISDFYKAVKAMPSAEPYKGMTNGEVMDKLFPELSELFYDIILADFLTHFLRLVKNFG